jgi:hypothetical protein
MLAGLLGALGGLFFPFIETIPFLESMNIWGQLVLRLALLLVGFLFGAALGALPVIVDSYYMAAGELKPPNPGPQADG